MRVRGRLVTGILACAGACFLVQDAAAQNGQDRQRRDGGPATVVNSGSTNTAGFRILVERDGRTQVITLPHRPTRPPVESPEPVIGMIPAALAKRLYSDLDAGWPLTSLPGPHCLKSVSFGTRLTIEFDHQSTPDLSCGDGGNPKLRSLIEDAREIVRASGK